MKALLSPKALHVAEKSQKRQLQGIDLKSGAARRHELVVLHDCYIVFVVF